MYKKGKIILVPFPFTDLSASKVRPAAIISYGAIGDDVVVAFISSQKLARQQKFDILLEESDVSFGHTGLKTASVIKISKIATLDKKIILGEIGEFDGLIINKINQRLKALFNL